MGTVGLQAFNTAGYGPATLQYHLPARCHDDGPPNRGDYATGLILDLTNQDWSVVVAVNALVDVFSRATCFLVPHFAMPPRN